MTVSFFMVGSLKILLHKIWVSAAVTKKFYFNRLLSVAPKVLSKHAATKPIAVEIDGNVKLFRYMVCMSEYHY